MNIFTKEELQIINSHLKEEKFIMDDNLRKIIDKIKSTIDDYCEHECEIEYRLPTKVYELFSGKERKVSLCKKCEEMYIL